MRRYTKIPPGASFVSEYGDPDSPDWEEFLHRNSPYHNIEPRGDEAPYPPLFMSASTRDDRAHPYHARAFVKRLGEAGHPHTLYYENIEGGHSGAADPKQQAFMTSLWISFLWKTVGKGWNRSAGRSTSSSNATRLENQENKAAGLPNPQRSKSI
jgi:prolyl oligopeptidase